MIGRVDMLDARKAEEHWKAEGLDLSRLLYLQRPRIQGEDTYCSEGQDHGLERALDHELIKQSQAALEKQQTVEIQTPIYNSNRTVGAMLSGEIAKRYGEEGLPAESINVHFNGSAGQSFGAFLVNGVNFHLEGDANDYLGKGMSGGRIVICPPQGSNFTPEENIIIGNVALYGATGGQVFINGVAGERFCVRNSGVHAVVESLGDHGCEYMTGGVVVVLGKTGRNFAAGMSGGIAFVYDKDGDFKSRFNPGLSDLEEVTETEDQEMLRSMIEEHLALTGSAPARQMLTEWSETLARFKKIMPRDYRRVLEERTLRGAGELEVAPHG
jgi:glutamate synthase domain-containing protein 3